MNEKTTKNVDNSFEHVQFSSNHLEKAFKNSDETSQGIPLVPNVCTIIPFTNWAFTLDEEKLSPKAQIESDDVSEIDYPGDSVNGVENTFNSDYKEELDTEELENASEENNMKYLNVEEATHSLPKGILKECIFYSLISLSIGKLILDLENLV